MKLERTLTLLFITLFSLSFNANAKEVSPAVAACNDAVNKGDADAAIAAAETLLKQTPGDHEGLICKGRALGQKKQYAEALKTFELAMQATEKPFAKIITHILIGNLHKTNQKFAEAIASYEKSLGLCGQTGNQTYSRINHNLIGDAHQQAGDLNAALDSYIASTRLANNDNERADSFSRLASAYHALDNYDKAIEFQVKAVVMQQKAGTLTDYAEALLTLGEYHHDAKDYPNAERTYKKLIKFSQDNGGAYYEAKAKYQLSASTAANGDQAEAKILLDDALKLAKQIGATQLAGEIEKAQTELNS